MSCSQLRQFLDAWLDGELDTATSLTLTAHARTCVRCADLKAQREALITRVQDAIPRFKAPARLHAAVQGLSQTAGPRNARPRWWHAAGLALVSSALSVALTLLLVGRAGQRADPTNDELVSRHAQALAGPLVALGSGDRHQIKPWFHGKVDFAPVVRDLDPLGFELQGARLDRLGDRPVAVVVYRIRNHPINLFVWRSKSSVQDDLQLSRVRGFAMARWSDQGLVFAAVSDVDPRDLERFSRAVMLPRDRNP